MRGNERNGRRGQRCEAIFQCVELESRTLLSTYPLSSVPALDSNPGAPAKLYLDFKGDPATTWGSYSVPATPAYTTDSDPTTFSDAELANIREIWARVSEKYSPFNIDVTTVDPGTYPDKVAYKSVIGGGGSWAGGSYGGVTYVGSFYSSSQNWNYVFPANLGNGDPRYTAEAVAHETGHAFGLQHQSSYDSTGAKTAEYYAGNSQIAPIMGNSYYASRGIWWYGTSTSSTTYQDDLSILSNSNNGFGYRNDGIGHTLSSATPLTISGPSVSGSGILAQTTQRDYFSFTTDAGTITLNGNVAQYGAMLDLKLELWTSTGTLVATADTSSLGETLTVTVPAGSYRLVVASHGNYGDVGQYAVSGTIVPPVNFVAAPTGLTATVASATHVNLAWTNNASNATGFVVQRSADGGTTWVTLATTAANVTTYQDATAAAGATYSYRVYATGSASNSDFSNVASATTVPAAPASPTATAASASQINLSWTDVTGETGFIIQRSTDGVNWTQVGTTAVNVTTFQNTGLAMGTLYYYRVIAVGAAGNSAASSVASATTQTVSLPTAPTNVTATPLAKNKIKVGWVDTSGNETGFTVQRSTDNVKWTTIATVAANVLSYTDSGLKRGKYYYRVAAYNSAGSSAYSQVAYASMGDTATTTTTTTSRTFSTTSIASTPTKADIDRQIARVLRWRRVRVRR